MADANSTSGAPTSILEISAFDPEARDDPHPRMRALRETGRVLRDDTTKAWLLSHYDDIRETVNDGTFVRHPSKAEEGSITRMLVDPDDPEGRRTSILFMDDPDHARNRRPLMQSFYERIKKMQAEIEALIDGVIDSAPASGRFDLMEKVAVPVPILVIAHILGVDESRLEEFRTWSEGLILGLNPVRTPEQTTYMKESREKLDHYFTELMAARRETQQE
jgi:cytochrome P450